MIEYIVPSNIDDRVINKAARALEGGGLVALPTDTSWSVVCSMASPQGIKKLRRLSGERDERYFTLLCSSISQFGEFCSMDNSRFRLVSRLSPGPYVFILKTIAGTEKTLDIRRREVGLRIPAYPVPVRLAQAAGRPLYSITAKRSMAGGPAGEGSADSGDQGAEMPPVPEEELFESGWELEGIDGVDIILDSGEERERVFSTILDLCEGEVKLLRKGLGPWPA